MWKWECLPPKITLVTLDNILNDGVNFKKKIYTLWLRHLGFQLW
jgi:hypothetical protein